MFSNTRPGSVGTKSSADWADIRERDSAAYVCSSEDQSPPEMCRIDRSRGWSAIDKKKSTAHGDVWIVAR